MDGAKIVRVVVWLCIILLLTSCGGINKESVGKPIASRNLIEYEDGGVLYIQVSGYSATPYYSPNGKLCHYVDGEIVEIE